MTPIGNDFVERRGLGLGMNDNKDGYCKSQLTLIGVFLKQLHFPKSFLQSIQLPCQALVIIHILIGANHHHLAVLVILVVKLSIRIILR